MFVNLYFGSNAACYSQVCEDFMNFDLSYKKKKKTRLFANTNNANHVAEICKVNNKKVSTRIIFKITN